MRTYYYAEAVDNLVISRDHAVTFVNETLDYIPGSVLLGALASKVYLDDSFDEGSRFSLFQNNSNNCFSNAYPVKPVAKGKILKGETVLPAPLCLHYPKNKKAVREELVNKCAITEDDSIQYKQLRSGYLTSDMQQYSVNCSTVTRTAIDFRTQTADEGKLFNQKFIEKGAVFLGFIDYEEQYKELINEFLNGTEIRVGKSRYSEFGRIRLSIAQVNELTNPAPIQNNLLYIWCISDCQFIDLKTGQPTLVPQGSNLWHLSEKYSRLELEYLPEKSFIRTSVKRYFNRKRGGFDGDRQLVNKGSVICFKLNNVPDNKVPGTDILATQQKCGLGLDRQLGFGQIIINPEWINDSKIVKLFAPFEVELVNVSESKEKDQLNPNLLSYLKQAQIKFKDSLKYKENTAKHLKFVAHLYECIRKYNFIDKDQNFGPTATQWNEVFNYVKHDDYLNEVKTILFENIGNDLNPSPTNSKKVTSKEESESWGARLVDLDNKCQTYFAKIYFDYLVKSNFSKEQFLFNLEILVKNDFSKYELLKSYQRKGGSNE